MIVQVTLFGVEVFGDLPLLNPGSGYARSHINIRRQDEFIGARFW
jgi:hypothetical protein